MRVRTWRIQLWPGQELLFTARQHAPKSNGALEGAEAVDGSVAAHYLAGIAHAFTSRRAVIEIAEALGTRPQAGPFGHDVVAQAVDEVQRALERGNLLAFRPRLRRVIMRIDAPEFLGPADADPSADAPLKHWIGVKLVDAKTNDPLPGRPYAIMDAAIEEAVEAKGRLGADGTATTDLPDTSARRIRCPAYPALPATDHEVVQGEHASGIAEAAGYEDFNLVWNDASNADLRAVRKPHVLFPGDIVHIPARKASPSSDRKPVDQQHLFTVERSPLKLIIDLRDPFSHPLASIAATFAGKTSTTDPKGVLTMDIEKSQRGGKLSLPSKDLALLVGHLDPIEEDTGWRARLVNMGFMWDDEGGDEEDRIAIEDFQADEGLKITGTLDDATRAKILQAHGT